jgi:hypothetical protein
VHPKKGAELLLKGQLRMLHFIITSGVSSVVGLLVLFMLFDGDYFIFMRLL